MKSSKFYLPIKESLFCLLFLFSIALSASPQSKNFELTVNLTVDKNLKSSFNSDGRLFIFMTTDPRVEPRRMTWPNPWVKTYIFGRNFKIDNIDEGIKINNSVEWSGTTEWSLDEIPEGEYYIQILWDQDRKESQTNAPGNLYSETIKVKLNSSQEIDVILNKKIEQRVIIDHPLVRLVEMKSDTLSSWWNKTVFQKATILLPHTYEKGKAYPIRYNVAGYGGRFNRINNLVRNKDFIEWWDSDQSPEVISVFLDGEGPFGDSYQMDSENSGPYGYSLIYELIPYIESEYRGTDSPDTRFVDGCSTGGWVSLGLQLYYPDMFNGVFSYSPDAIEFENYQLINIYVDENAFVNEFGYLRPVMRDITGEPMLSLKDMIRYENVLGSSDTYLNSGGQFSAHTALYSPKGKNGLPAPLFDPFTGTIDHKVAEYWIKYDFKIYLKEHWNEVGPKLQGKIFIWMGDMDHFYLNLGTRAVADFLETTESPKSDAEIIFSPVEGHCSQYSHRTVLEQIQQKLETLSQ